MANFSFVDYYHIDECLPPSDGISYTDIISIIIAIFALYISIRTIVITKRKEIEYDKYKRITLELLNEQFFIIKEKIDLYKSNKISLANFSDSLTDLTLFFNSMKILYPKMDINKIQDKINDFSDNIFESSDNIDYKFIQLKTLLFASIYDYAITEIPLFLFWKKH
ncbi:hypothetical protein [Parabacteroides sp.]|jgi:hypothetical protein|uniref:hypothetical protein n=1 Tax=Parabacteroides TaxID=375288 RepID=UPI0020588D21|nr:hypothetical protein [Parabacteroides sp.]MDU7627704.1 hypothetical protein [Parabacteroides sp.]DAS69791.1 MAG TPA: hypothetical protein [Caudoviricetes sp.]